MGRLKKMISVCLAVMLVLTMCPQQVEAASANLHYSEIQITKSADKNHSYGYQLLDGNTNAKITKVVLSKKSLAKVTVNSFNKKEISIIPKKTGTANIKVTVKDGSETKTHTVKLKIYKYKNPMTTFKVGDTQYKSKFNKKKILFTKPPKKTKTVKLNVKAKKGQEIAAISYNCSSKNQSMSLKNGQKFKLYNKPGVIQILFRDKKTGCYSSIVIFYQ